MVAPNPTGSTGYGQSFTDAIRESWGGLPYQDLVSGFAYIKESMDYVDTDRAVALGASYGGYMMNWMQGHSLGKDFKGMSNPRASVFLENNCSMTANNQLEQRSSATMASSA